MENPGQQLRRIRERLGLRYRDVSRASSEIAARRGKPEFKIGLSRLADIENKGTLPTTYRLYSLAAIYKLEFRSVLRYYGIDLDHLATDAMQSPLESTTLLSSEAPERAIIPLPNTRFDGRHTVYLSRLMRSWGRMPAFLLSETLPAHNRYAFIGLSDRFMYPIIRPGSIVQIDPHRRKVAPVGWKTEWERPIYLVEHRDGFRCGWCSEAGEHLILQPHPASGEAAEVYSRSATEILGQVIAVAIRFDLAQLHRKHSSTALR